MNRDGMELVRQTMQGVSDRILNEYDLSNPVHLRLAHEAIWVLKGIIDSLYWIGDFDDNTYNALHDIADSMLDEVNDMYISELYKARNL